jgi:GPI mannosyltransferase 1 subunit M
MSLRHILITGGAVRLALLIFGAWQDATLPVKYTDIDYEVYTDAARFMTQGESPYRRSTYRYSPLLAAALMPNIWLHPAFGKVLFSAADIVAATLMATLLARRKVPQRQQLVGLGLWLFSPFTVTISTRGNGEALVTCMLLFMLVLIEKGGQ